MEQYFGAGTICRAKDKEGHTVYGYYVEVPAPLKSKADPVGFIYYPNKERDKKECYMKRVEVDIKHIDRAIDVYDMNKQMIYENDKVKMWRSEKSYIVGKVCIDYGTVFVRGSGWMICLDRNELLEIINKEEVK